MGKTAVVEKAVKKTVESGLLKKIWEKVAKKIGISTETYFERAARLGEKNIFTVNGFRNMEKIKDVADVTSAEFVSYENAVYEKAAPKAAKRRIRSIKSIKDDHVIKTKREVMRTEAQKIAIETDYHGDQKKIVERIIEKTNMHPRKVKNEKGVEEVVHRAGYKSENRKVVDDITLKHREKYNTRLSKERLKLDSKADDFQAKLGEVRNKAREEMHLNIEKELKAKEIEYSPIELSAEDLAHPVNMFEKLPDELIEPAFEELYKNIYSTRKAMIRNIKTQFKASQMMNMFGVSTNASLMYEMLQSQGFDYAAASAKNFYHYIEMARVADMQMGGMSKHVLAEFGKFEKESQNAIREYVETFRFNKLTREVMNVGEAGISNAIMVDAKRAAELMLEPKQIEMANRIINMNRTYRSVFDELGSMTFEPRTSVNKHASIDEWWSATRDIDVTDSSWSKMQNSEIGDVGSNYWHKVFEQTGEEVRSAGGKTGFTQGRTSTELNYDKRIGAQEELERYISEFRYETIKKKGMGHLGKVAATISDDITSIVGLSNKKHIHDVSSKFEDVFQQVYESYSAVFNRPKIINDESLTSFIYKGALGTADVQTALALSSPFTAAWNTVQPVATTSINHGLGNVFRGMKEISKALGKTAVDKGRGVMRPGLRGMQLPHERGLFKMVTSGKWLDVAVDHIHSNSLHKDDIAFYFNAYGHDILMGDAFAMNSAVRQGMNLSTTMLKSSDVLSRLITIESTATQVDRTLASYIVKEGWHKDKTVIERLIKDFNLHEFDSITREDLTLLLTRGNVKKFRNLYTAKAVQSEIFDYSAWGRATLINRAVTSPLMSRAARFISWPLFYTELMTGVKRSWDAGNKEPLTNMLKVSAMWLGATAGLDRYADEGSNWDKFLMKGVSRTPIISPATMLATRGMGDAAGVGTSVIAGLAWPLLKSSDVVFELSTGKSKTPASFYTNKAESILKYSPVGSLMEDLGIF